MGSEQRIIKNFVFMALQPIFMNVISLFATAYIARKLGAVDFGIFNLAILFSTFFYPIGLLGLNTISIRDIAGIRDDSTIITFYISRLFTLRIIISVLALACLIVTAAILDYPDNIAIALYLAGFVLLFQLLAESVSDVFSAMERMECTALTSLFAGLSLTILSVAALYAGYGLLGVLKSYIIGQFLGWGAAVLVFHRLFFRVKLSIDFQFWMEKIRAGLPFISMSLMWAAMGRLDTIFLSKIISAESLGYYTSAMLLVSKINIIPEALCAAILPAVSNLYRNNEIHNIGAIYHRFFVYALLISLPICIGTCVFTKEIILLLFGIKYSESAGILSIAIWLFLLRSVMLVQFAVLTATLNQSLILKSYILSFVLCILLNAILTYSYHILGALFALLGTHLILLTLFSYSLVRSIRIKYNFRKVFLVVTLNAVFAVFLLSVRSVNFFLVLAVSSFLYFAAIFATRIVSFSEFLGLIPFRRSA
jgi:O-antigen/teichoic acid export membrane protein